MVDQMLAADPIAALQITHIETFQQEFSLIEPGSMCRCKQDPEPCAIIGFQKGEGCSRDVAGTAIPDQVNASK